MNKENCLIIIDMQVGIFHLKQTVFNQKMLVNNINTVIREARKQHFPIIFTQHENKTFLRKDTADWEILPGLKTKDDDIQIYKSHSSIFKDTKLEQILNEINAKNLYICGLITNGCIQQACVQALEKGYQVTLISDAHSTFYKSPEKIINEWNEKLEEQGVVLTNTRSFLSPI